MSNVRVTVRRTGGIAGITRQGAAELADTSDLVAALESASATAASVPDAFSYHVTVGDREWTVDEHALPADLRGRLEEMLERG